ncbi:hypothetical protein IE81DRAFT_344566 [Ceraceosorus guamensis]|uniref:CipC-like antibiotic response protein n=1 Tax=Ceraceosorus guamensis TaxID=1522189 RepID=A0A316WAA9_9BASI|nr:hypothetical protein IE81DRAFT_344566 [Ceraceosorus guamensis]PWN45671.1 hypothetical protein IE81DRAFT_344566 [Ceraceosorus guamensis]
MPAPHLAPLTHQHLCKDIHNSNTHSKLAKMGFFSSDNHQEVYNGEPHEGKWTHELVGGAAAFEAMRKYEQHEAANGKPANHALAKEILAGIAGAEADKLFETKGLDFIDRERAKHHAQEEAKQQYEQQYQ